VEDQIVMIVRELGSLGIIGMSAWYLFRFYLPRRDQEHQEALERTQISFEKLLLAQGETFRSGMQSLSARVKKSSENIGRVIEAQERLTNQLRDHEQREEVQLEQHTGYLTKIESHLEKMAAK